jgi:hypothetical protein
MVEAPDADQVGRHMRAVVSALELAVVEYLAGPTPAARTESSKTSRLSSSTLSRISETRPSDPP